MFKKTRLYTGPLLSISDVVCDADKGGCGDLERASSTQVVVPSGGAFACHMSPRDSFVADANAAVVLRPGTPYKVSHPIAGGDVSVLIESDDEEIFGALGAVTTLSTRAALMVRLANAAAKDASSALQVEEYALAFIDALAPSTPRPKAAMVERAKAVIAEDPFDERSLADIAFAVGASPFYLTRTFRRATGLSLHAYRMQLRLQRGLERAVAGDHLATVALDCGFSSHSQFTAAFRRQFGAPPSHYARFR